MTGFEPTNLDCQYIEDLHTLERVYSLLAMYARRRASSMKNRVEGRLREAQSDDHFCEVVYKQLPEWAKW